VKLVINEKLTKYLISTV